MSKAIVGSPTGTDKKLGYQDSSFSRKEFFIHYIFKVELSQNNIQSKFNILNLLK